MSAHARDISSAVMQRLVYARLILHDGLRTARTGRTGFQGLAVLAFQDCIEMVLFALAEHLNVPEIKERIAFDALVTSIRNATPDVAFPHAATVTRVNKARIGFKHYGNIPAGGDVEDFSKDTQLFFDDILLKYFSLSAEDISVALLIENPRARRYLLCAEREWTQEQYVESVEYAAKAFAVAFGEVRRPDSFPDLRPQPLDDRNMNPFHHLEDVHTKLYEISHNLAKRISEIEKRHVALDRFVELLMVNIDIFRYAQFANIAPHVQVSSGGKVFVQPYHRPPEITKNDAQKALHFVQDSLMASKGFYRPPQWTNRDRPFTTNAVTKVYFQEQRNTKGKYFCDLPAGTEVFALPESYNDSPSIVTIDLDYDLCVVDCDSLTEVSN